MTDRQTALDELIAGDADLYDPNGEHIANAAMDTFMYSIQQAGGFKKIMESMNYSSRIRSMMWLAVQQHTKHLTASARIKGDKDRETPVERPQAEQFAENAKSSPEVKALVGAVKWYAEQAAGCRKIGGDGDVARQALHRDGGQRARSALAAFEGIE